MVGTVGDGAMTNTIAAIGTILIDLAVVVGFFAIISMMMDTRNPEPGYVLAGCLIVFVIGGMMGGAQ
jgi:protein-S-isoprenylcysteine O-methyltransferase Ste14